MFVGEEGRNLMFPIGFSYLTQHIPLGICDITMATLNANAVNLMEQCFTCDEPSYSFREDSETINDNRQPLFK